MSALIIPVFVSPGIWHPRRSFRGPSPLVPTRGYVILYTASFSLSFLRAKPSLFWFSKPHPSVSLLLVSRGSLSSHYYCPILPLSSFFMPPRRSLRCYSNLPWLMTVAIKARSLSPFSPVSSFRALFNTRRLIFHRAISPSSRTTLSLYSGDRLGPRNIRRRVDIFLPFFAKCTRLSAIVNIFRINKYTTMIWMRLKNWFNIIK